MGVEVVNLRVESRETCGGRFGGASSAHQRWGETEASLSFLDVVSQAVLGETKRGHGTVPGSWDEGTS